MCFIQHQAQQATSVTDQAGTVHSDNYDKLGRMTQDRITTLGSGVDSAVRRIAMTYEVRGMREKLTSYDNSTVGSGNIVNEVKFTYNDFSQLTKDFQSHSGGDDMTTPFVQFAYANGSAGSMADAASRIASLVDDDNTHLADYSYLGERSFVVADSPQPQVKWTLASLTGSNEPDTGDMYAGLNRFGRVKDNRWYDYGASADADRIRSGIDQHVGQFQGEVLPGDAGLEHEQDAGEDGAVLCWRATTLGENSSVGKHGSISFHSSSLSNRVAMSVPS